MPDPLSAPVILPGISNRLQSQADIAGLADGGYVAVWRSQTTGPTQADIYQQRFAADGTALGEAQVIGQSGLRASNPAVTALADGGWTVFWGDTGFDGRRYAADGSEVDSTRNETISTFVDIDNPDPNIGFVIVDTDLLGTDAYGGAGNVNLPGSVAVTDLADGGFAIVYDFDSGPLREEEVAQIRYGATTDPAPAAVLQPWDLLSDNFERSDRQRTPDIAGLNDGSRVMVWRATEENGGSPTLRAQRTGADDAILGPSFEVATGTATRDPNGARITALEGGGYVVAWTEFISDDAGNASDIFARVYANDGTIVNAGFQVNGITFSTQTDVSLAALADGGFVAVWNQFDTIDSEWEVWGRLFDNQGMARDTAFFGGNFRIDTNDNFSAFGPEVTALASGGFSVTWTAETATRLGSVQDTDIAVRSFAAPGDIIAEDLNLTGTTGNDRLEGMDGDDTIRGLDGLDTLIGGAGDDFIFAGGTPADLRDLVFGGAGNDTIDGGYGNDELRGDAGNDSIAGGFGADTVIGGTGNDILTGSALGDLIFGGDDDDFLNGGFGSDRLNGGAGADRFFHLGVPDHGNDWIQDYNAAQGDVLVYGGSATRDQFQINSTFTPGAGQDLVREAFVIYRPTGDILWALVDGLANDAITLRIGGQDFDLLA
ncbi:hypothetical protein [Tateyamaria sp. ANG-S1]|uniref:calcium-binding protein n=1 Tax=Tateyamaria sp. ANG-S1 TaxID=1577905 RepID=UPI000691007F|nr:hypothetical protein [Tateyamaria sp. ANG-S1]